MELTRLPGPDHLDATVSQVRYPSTDGVDVPMLLVHATATTIDARTPTLLTGYGGFNITETPAWSPFIAVWCEQGGQVAVPGLRGGGEEGEAWHQAGMRANKPQVFADFEAAADWLVAERADVPRAPGHPGRFQRRAAGGGVHGAAPRPVRGGGVRRAR